MRTLVYTRVSTSEQVERYGLDTQLRNCRSYAANNGMEIVVELSDDISGAVKIAERPQGKLIYQYVDNREVDAVLMPTIDRTSRDEKAIEYQLFKLYLNDNDVELHYADSGVDHDTMEGDLIGYIKAKMAGEERKKIMLRTMEGKVSKALKNKLVMIGHPPFGYYREGKKDTAKLLIDPQEAQVVKLIFNWYARGDDDGKPLALRAIAIRLIESGVLTPHYKKNAARYWIPATLHGILTNEIYTGVTYYRKTKVVKVKGKKRRIKNPPEEWIKIDVPELAIIDKATFDLAQQRAEINRQLATRNRKSEYLLSGFFRCGACGGAMSGTSAGLKRYKSFSYRCGAHWHKPDKAPCPNENRTIEARNAETLVWAWIEGILTDDDNLEMGLRRMAELHRSEADPKRKRLEAVDELLEKSERKVKRLIETLQDEEDNYLVAELRTSLKTASKQVDGFKKEKESLLFELDEQEISPEKLDMVRQRAAEIRQKLGNPTYSQKRIVFDMIRLECVFRVDESGWRWIDARCDLLPEGAIIKIKQRPSSTFFQRKMGSH